MKCPACHSELIVLEQNQIEIDHCISCKGVWLDSIELELLFEGSQKASSWFESFQLATANVSERNRKCPICDRAMKKVYFSTDQDKILLDQCKRNDGVWCDQGELARMVQAKHSESGSQVLNLLREVFVK